MISEYLKKNTKLAKNFTYRPSEYYKNKNNTDINIVLCSISETKNLQFSYGADVLEKYIRKDKQVYLDRACLYPKSLFNIIGINKSIYTNKPVRDFDLILISAFMVQQVFNIIPFLLQSKINPIKNKREQIVILGGNVSLYYKLIEDYIDVFYFRDGEVNINEIINLKRLNKGKKEFLNSLKQSNFYESLYIDEKKEIIPAIQKNIGDSIINGNEFISKPVNKVLEIGRGCKYDCNFCMLSHYKVLYRENKILDIENSLCTFKKGTVIYPFAPDEASYSNMLELNKIISQKELKQYSYNKRFNTFNKEKDLGFKSVFLQIAPTPFVPMISTPLETIEAFYNITIKTKLINLINKLCTKYKLLKVEGLNDVSTWETEVIFNRCEPKIKPILLKWAIKQGVNPYNTSMAKYFIKMCENNGYRRKEYLKAKNYTACPEIKFRFDETKRNKIKEEALNEFKRS